MVDANGVDSETLRPVVDQPGRSFLFVADELLVVPVFLLLVGRRVVRRSVAGFERDDIAVLNFEVLLVEFSLNILDGDGVGILDVVAPGRSFDFWFDQKSDDRTITATASVYSRSRDGAEMPSGYVDDGLGIMKQQILSLSRYFTVCRFMCDSPIFIHKIFI